MKDNQKPTTAGNLEKAARRVGLRYVSVDTPGIHRIKAGTGFRYETPGGRTLADARILKRIAALVIPPAWTEVWISTLPTGHIQATGRDAKGRKQYIYHARFREMRETAKFEHMLQFAERLPSIRATVREHLSLPGLKREKVLATIVQLLEETLIRIGNDEYARSNRSYGLTTLKSSHVEVEGAALKFNFKGKSGKVWNLSARDRRIARIIAKCQELPGQELFQYIGDDGAIRGVTSSDVNDYLREISGDAITAKDFRTWHGTVLAATTLAGLAMFESATAAKRNMRDAIKLVASRLGNTPTICRKCYIHPEIFLVYNEGALALDVVLSGSVDALKPAELSVLRLLSARAKTTST